MQYYFVSRSNGVGQKSTITLSFSIKFEPNEKDFIKDMNISVGDTICFDEKMLKKSGKGSHSAYKILEKEFIIGESDITMVVFEVEDVTISYKKRSDVFGKLNFAEEVPDIYSVAKNGGIIKC